jgi:hypothetical protein
MSEIVEARKKCPACGADLVIQVPIYHHSGCLFECLTIAAVTIALFAAVLG